MALINCPECTREISDKATACPHCGYPVSSHLTPLNTPEAPPQSEAVNNDTIVTSQPQSVCSNQAPHHPDSSGNTQYVPLEGTQPPRRRPTSFGHTKKKLALFVIIVAAIAVAVSVFIYQRSKQQSIIASYTEDINSIVEEMSDGAMYAEQFCRLTSSVWQNTIFEELNDATDPFTLNKDLDPAEAKALKSFNDDFNTSLDLLYSDETSQKRLKYIMQNQRTVADLYERLQNPPDDFSLCYATLNDTYDFYLAITNLAANPAGNLTTYSEKVSEYSRGFIDNNNKLKLQIPK